jgi:flagellar biosynthesis GTPase FlhF
MSHLQDLTVDWVSLVDRAAVRDPQNKSEPRRFLLWKREGTTTPTAREGGDHMQKTEDELRAAVEKAEKDAQDARTAQEKAEKERDEAVAKATEAEEKDKDDDRDGGEESEVNKAELPPSVRAALEKAEKDAADAKARIEKAEKDAHDAAEIAKAERDQRVTQEFIKKAEGFKALSVKPVEFGPVLKRASEKLEKADFEVLEELLKAADEQIAKGDLFKEMGSGVGGSVLPSDALGELQRKAEELRKNDSALSIADAQERVMKNDPDLQARYLAEQRG